jgi:glycosyltransferase involved in cell wall biosynthesis
VLDTDIGGLPEVVRHGETGYLYYEDLYRRLLCQPRPEQPG